MNGREFRVRGAQEETLGGDMAQEPNYSPEVIRRYREMERHGGFERKIEERAATIRCGMRHFWMKR